VADNQLTERSSRQVAENQQTKYREPANRGAENHQTVAENQQTVAENQQAVAENQQTGGRKPADRR
jgi:hypothetical protein